MNDKLKELTEKIRREGIEEAKAEADRIIGEANNKSTEIIESARKEAEKTTEDTREKSREMVQNARSEMRIAFRQAVSSLKQDIESLILARMTEKPVGDMFQDDSFVNRLMMTMLENWDLSKAGAGLDLLLPGKKLEQAEQYFKKHAEHLMGKGLQLKPSDNLDRGFEISSRDEGFKISVTDSDFEAYLKDFIRPGLRKMLFEEDGDDG